MIHFECFSASSHEDLKASVNAWFENNLVVMNIIDVKSHIIPVESKNPTASEHKEYVFFYQVLYKG